MNEPQPMKDTSLNDLTLQHEGTDFEHRTYHSDTCYDANSAGFRDASNDVENDHQFIEQATPWSLAAQQTQAIMLQNGWCPEQIKHLMRTKALRIVHHLAKINKCEHRVADHSSCTDGRCSAFSVNMQSYMQQHTEDCSRTTCYTVQTPQARLKRVIKRGKVPLISIHDHPEKGLSLRVHQRGYGDKYTSISHVWADGLGNQRATSLPACQIRNLKMIFERACEQNDTLLERISTCVYRTRSKPSLFWMDTLCIPPRSEDEKLKTVAIRSMPSIYHGSERVLVIDKELMAIKYDEDNVESRIISSLWMSRSWTLQEAMLPKESLFLFDSHKLVYVDIQEWFDERPPQPTVYNIHNINPNSDPHSIDEIFVSPTLTENLIQTDVFGGEEYARFAKLILVWNNLAGRATTKAEDLYVVLATCLEFRLQPVEQLATVEDKMAGMLLSYDSLPFSLLFTTGLRSKSANKWLPAEICSELLTPCSIIHLSDEDVRTSPALRLSLGEDLSIYILDQIPSDLSNFTIQDQNDQRISFLIEAIDLSQDEKKPSSCEKICIMVEVFQLGVSTTRRGAAFYLIHDTAYGARRVIHYVCSIRASRVLRSDHRRPNHYLATRETHGSGFLLKFYPLPLFKPLPRLVYEEFKLEPWFFVPTLDYYDGGSEKFIMALALIIVYLGVLVGLQLALYYALPPSSGDGRKFYVICLLGLLAFQVIFLFAAGRWLFGLVFDMIMSLIKLVSFLILQPLLAIQRVVMMGPIAAYRFIYYYATQYQKFDDNTIIDRSRRKIDKIFRLPRDCLNRFRRRDVRSSTRFEPSTSGIRHNLS